MYGRAKSQTPLYKLTMTDRVTDGQKKRLIGVRAFALPKNEDDLRIVKDHTALPYAAVAVIIICSVCVCVCVCVFQPQQ